MTSAVFRVAVDTNEIVTAGQERGNHADTIYHVLAPYETPTEPVGCSAEPESRA